MADYIEIDEACTRPGLRLVLTAGVPGPFGEAAKAIFHVKKIAYLKVRQTPGESDEALGAWTAQTSAPVAVYEDERPRSGWADILYLAQRVAAEPRLIPEAPDERALMFGLSNEICGEGGFGWQRRLTLLDSLLKAGGGGVAARAEVRPFGSSGSRRAGSNGTHPRRALCTADRAARARQPLLRRRRAHRTRPLLGNVLDPARAARRRALPGAAGDARGVQRERPRSPSPRRPAAPRAPRHHLRSSPRAAARLLIPFSLLERVLEPKPEFASGF